MWLGGVEVPFAQMPYIQWNFKTAHKKSTILARCLDKTAFDDTNNVFLFCNKMVYLLAEIRVNNFCFLLMPGR